MGKKNILSIFLIIGMALLMCNFVTAYDSHKQNTDFMYSTTVANADTCNLTGISYPDGTSGSLDIGMDKEGFKFSSNITSGNFSQLGTTCFDILCYDADADPKYEEGTKCLEVTPTGNAGISSGQSNILLIVDGLLLILFILFFIYSFKAENPAPKLICMGLSIIVFITILVFNMVSLRSMLGEWSSIVDGFSTIYWLGLFLVVVIFVFLLLVLFKNVVDMIYKTKGLR